MIRRCLHKFLTPATVGIFLFSLVSLAGLSACAQPAATTPVTKPAPVITEEKTSPPEEKVVTEEKATSTPAPSVTEEKTSPPEEKVVTEEKLTPTPTPTPASMKIDISGFAFASATVTIPVGTTVTWTNRDSVAHTVSSRDNLFDSGTLSSGATFSYTFNQIGTFQYYCNIHPTMTGKVIVGPEGTVPTEEKAAPTPGGNTDYY